jgi:putative PEP-CTERM system histidine kinase
VLLLGWLLVGVKPPGLVDTNPLTRQLGHGSALIVAAFGLVLVEQCYRRTPFASRWHIRPLVLAFAGLFAFDVVLYSDSMLFGVVDFDLWAARGFAQALTVPLVLATLRRRADWSFDLAVSRGVVAGSTALALTGGYLLLIATAGFALREFGGSWGKALQSALVFASFLLLAAVALSGSVRAKVRVFVAKHFFSYRYDYREEWLRFTNTLAAEGSLRSGVATIHAIANLVESPGGALWLVDPEGNARQTDRDSFPACGDVLSADDALIRFLKETGWVLELAEVRTGAPKYGALVLPPSLGALEDAWLLVPLQAAQDFVGFVVLSTPRARVEVDWEVLDLLKTAGRQAAGYLAYARATEALLEAQKFEAFHRMSTFVVHDLKNLIAQLQLLLSNAERHRDNPDFQRDMLKTVDHVSNRMHQLILQLKPEASARDRAQAVDVGAVVHRVQALRQSGGGALDVVAAGNLLVWAHDDLLERVIAHLVQNAFDASQPGDEVRIRVQAADDEVLIEVSDHGKGMTAEFMRDRLFKPFQTTKATGMGIGVYECRQYVQQIGGRMEVESAPDKGTRVRIYLRPVRPTQAELGAAA